MSADQTNTQNDASVEELKSQLDEARRKRDELNERISEIALEIEALDESGEALQGEELDPMSRLETELREWQNKYKRALADYQNYQRRAIENENEARQAGVRSVVERLLTVLDNFDLALSSVQTESSAEALAKGVTVIRDEMNSVLSSLGLKAITPEPGDEFDPMRHEAMTQIPAEGIEPGKVSQSLQCGYMLGDRVLRPAKVAIAPHADEEE